MKSRETNKHLHTFVAMDKSTVNKALTADESPTPGYLYNEIASKYAAAALHFIPC